MEDPSDDASDDPGDEAEDEPVEEQAVEEELSEEDAAAIREFFRSQFDRAMDAMRPRIDFSALYPKIDMTPLHPKFDFSTMYPKVHFSRFMPQIDKGVFMPKVDPSSWTPAFDAARFAPKVDPRLFAPQIDTSFLRPKFVVPDLLSAETRRTIEALLRTTYPDNWPAPSDGVPTRLEIAAWINEVGWPLSWVPRAEIVVALVSAAPEDRDGVLLDAESEILEDCAAQILELQSEPVERLRPFAQQIVDAMSDGYYAAAQALAATVISTVLQGTLGWRTFGEARNSLNVDASQFPVWKARIFLVLGCIPGILSGFWPHKGDTVPDSFNRHATAHAADPDQFTRRNAILAVIFAVALLRSIEDLSRRGRWEEFLADGEGSGFRP